MPPAHAAADIVHTPTAEAEKIARDRAAPPAAPPKPKESPSQLEARILRDKLGHVVDALANHPGEFGICRLGAALIAAHWAAVEGVDTVSSWTPGRALAEAEAFRSRFPVAWGAAASVNFGTFVNALMLYRARGAEDELAADAPFDVVKDFKSRLIVEYQTAMSRFAGS